MRRGRTAAALVAAVVCTDTGNARASWTMYDRISTYGIPLCSDTASLVAASDAIVRAAPAGSRWEVKRVFLGALLEGALIDVDRVPAACGSFDEAVLFISTESTERGRILHVVVNGIVFIAGGKVYDVVPRFPWKTGAAGSFSPEPRQTLEELESDLLAAIRRVEVFRRAMKAPKGESRSKAGLHAIEPHVMEADAFRRMGSMGLEGPDTLRGFFFLEEVGSTLWRAGDIEGALEVVARTIPLPRPWLETPEALRAAADGDLSPRHRAAAIWMLQWSLFKDTPALEAILELASDPAPEVREAALKKLEWLQRGYSMNYGPQSSKRSPDELREFWIKAGKVIEETRKDAR